METTSLSLEDLSSTTEASGMDMLPDTTVGDLSTMMDESTTVMGDLSTMMDLTTMMENDTNSSDTNSGGGSSPNSLRNVVEIVLFIVLAIAMFGIGCGVDLDKLKAHFKKPTGAVIGIVCQFGKFLL